MRAYVAAFVLATIASAIVTPIARWLALRLGAVSAPGGRHVHATATPRLGGVAILTGFAVAFGALSFANSSVADIVRSEGWRSVGLLLGAAALSTLGFVDDVHGVRAAYKLAFQLVVATFAFVCGFRIHSISVPGLGGLAMGVFALPVTVLWITGIVNAVNLIDGLDGLAAGVVLFAAITNFVVANLAGNVFIAATMATMGGAVLGFLFFNFNPARIFMGDAGSYFLGYVLATSVLIGGSSQKTSTAVALLAPCLALGVPIFDTLLSMLRRFLERRPLFSPDRGHLHHRLLDMGLTHRRAVLTLYGVSIVFSISAIAITFGSAWQIGGALLVATAVLFLLVRSTGYFAQLRLHLIRRGRLRSPHTDALLRVLVRAPSRFALAQNDDEIFAALDEFGALLGLHGLHVLEAQSRRPVHEWHAPENSVQRDWVANRFVVGDEARARARITFVWPEDAGALSADTEVLLQVLVAFLEQALVRTRSALAPEPVPATPLPTERPARRAPLPDHPLETRSSAP